MPKIYTSSLTRDQFELIATTAPGKTRWLAPQCQSIHRLNVILDIVV
jgi:hypothetical protein